MKYSLYILLGLCLLFSGCFYSFNPGGEPLIESIAVEQFENKTIEVSISNTMTDLVIDALIRDGNLKVVSESSAEGILSGTLTSYKRDAHTFDDADNVTDYIIKLNFNVTLIKSDSDEELWSETFYSEGIYSADSETEEDGQLEAIDLLVQKIINKTTKSW